MPRKIQKPHPNLLRENPGQKKIKEINKMKIIKMHSLRRFTGNSTNNLQKLCAQRKTPDAEIR